MNDPVFVEAAQALARRIVPEGGAEPKTGLPYAFRLCLARAPDAILEIRDRGALAEDRRQALAGDWSRLASVPAVRQNRVHIVSGTGLTVPGPRVAAAIERLARVLHPDRMAP